MLANLRARLTYANVVATLALFVAVSTGGAYAANTVFSTDIADGEVKTPDVAAGAVTATKLGVGAVGTDKLAGGAVTSEKVRDNSLGGRDVFDNSLKGADIDESTLSSIGGGGPAGGDLTGTYPNPAIRSNAIGTGKVTDNALTGADIAEPTLGQVPSALIATLGGLGRGGPIEDTCSTAGNFAFTTCAAVQLTVPPGPGAQALVLGRANAFPAGGSSEGIGSCRLGTSTVGPVPHTTVPVSTPAGFNFVNLVGITPLLGPGLHTFGIECAQTDTDSNIDFNEASVQVVALSPN